MNILTDILSLFKRKQFVKDAKPSDVVVLGINEPPEIEGIASPVPYKNVKLIKIQDLLTSSDCIHTNVPDPSIYAGVFRDKTTDPVTGKCFINFRRFKSLSLNLTINENGDFIDIDCLAEANTASNVGTGAQVFKQKVGEDLEFRTLSSSDASITITQGVDEIDLVQKSPCTYPTDTFTCLDEYFLWHRETPGPGCDTFKAPLSNIIPCGPWSIAQTNGIKTYYADLNSALTAATAGETVHMETDVTGPSLGVANLVNRVDINFNGFVYTVDDPGTDNIITDNNVAVTVNMYNGDIRRIGQSVTGTANTSVPVLIQNADTQINFNNTVNITNSDGYGIVNNGKISNVIKSVGTLAGILLENDVELRNCYGQGTSIAGIAGLVTSSILEDCVGEGENGDGINITFDPLATEGKVERCTGYSNKAAGILLQGTGDAPIEAIDVVGYGPIGLTLTDCKGLGGKGFSTGAGTFGVKLTDGNYVDFHGIASSGVGLGIYSNNFNIDVINCSGLSYNYVGGILDANDDSNVTVQNSDFNSLHPEAVGCALLIQNVGVDALVDLIGGTYAVTSNLAYGVSANLPFSIHWNDLIFRTDYNYTINPNLTNLNPTSKRIINSSGCYHGNIDITGQVFTNMYEISDPGSGAIPLDFDNGSVQKITLTASAAYSLGAPTNINEGATYMLTIMQPALTGNATLTFSADYLFPGGTVPTITAAAGSVDVLSFLCVDTGSGLKLISVPTQDFQ
tara:strand:- start:18931 stop:21144 length:2214 start_codon:yes stop_codon:yes gene_type:complete